MRIHGMTSNSTVHIPGKGEVLVTTTTDIKQKGNDLKEAYKQVPTPVTTKDELFNFLKYMLFVVLGNLYKHF
jgi:hypothetical protein